MRLSRRTVLLATVALAPPLVPLAARAAGIPATLYKDAECGCCEEYARYLETHGFAVERKNTTDMASVHATAGVPFGLDGCHATFIGGYVVEGHVPVAAIRKLLAEKPAIRGISLPGMPAGSPGMDGTKVTSFHIYAITDRGPLPFMED